MVPLEDSEQQRTSKTSYIKILKKNCLKFLTNCNTVNAATPSLFCKAVLSTGDAQFNKYYLLRIKSQTELCSIVFSSFAQQ